MIKDDPFIALHIYYTTEGGKSMELFLEIFVSVFFLFGLYCAAVEIYKLAVRIYRALKKRREIDKKRKKS